jgi:uncharacterized protein (DUF885 family)
MLSAAFNAPAPSALAQPTAGTLADRYVEVQLELDPTYSVFSGLPASNDQLPAISPAGIRKGLAAKQDLQRQLSDLDLEAANGSELRIAAVLKEALANDIAMRSCRQEYWSLNHIFGWQISLPQLALAQPVGSAAERAAALARWSAFPQYLEQDQANLTAGLERGYSTPKGVVRRVIAQVDALLALDAAASPFASPGRRSSDLAFRAAFDDLVRTTIHPALRSYRDFLSQTYLPQARDELGVSSLPDGRRCYEASLRFFTTLPVTPEATYAAGERTVAINRAEIQQIGRRLFGIDDVGSIMRQVDEASANRISSPEELLAFSNDRLPRNEAATRGVIAGYPAQRVTIAALPIEVTTAPPPHYEPEADPAKPGRYVLPLAEWKSISRSKAEMLVVHEAVPGHHVQLSAAFQRRAAHPIDKIAVNAAFTEGWARYAETLAEEIGLYGTDYPRIERRTWPGHGQMLDVGVHVGGWTRTQAVAFLKSTGAFDDAATDAMLDRVAALPGQLTAYDTGATEILALRAEAQARLGSRFDIRRFHQAVLEQGAVPLVQLRTHLEAWIAAQEPVAKH